MSLLCLNINTLIESFRAKLPAECATAIAIDRKEPRTVILSEARREGFIEFVLDLELAMRGGRPVREERRAA